MAKQVDKEPDASSLPAGPDGNPGELEVLRDLIFGNQARDFARRFSDIDGRLESLRRELKTEQDSLIQSLAKSSTDQTTTLRKEAHNRVDKEVQLLSERIEQLTTDVNEQLEGMRQALEAKLERIQTESRDRIRLLEEQARQRDDDLRAELLTVSAWLEDKKTSRHDLGSMLEELGQRLQRNAQAPTSDPEAKA